MRMTNTYVLIKPDETPQDIIAEICDDCGIKPNEPFAFSAVLLPDKELGDDDFYRLKINSIVPPEENPFTVEELIYRLYEQDEPANGVRYVQPTLERWLTEFKPLLSSLVHRVYPRYENTIPDKDEVTSILYLVVVRLYRQGYYLHQTLIRKSFVNELNLECRRLRGQALTDSLDEYVGEDDEGNNITLHDRLADPDTVAWARQNLLYTEDDYWEDMFEKIKARMLEDMSELAFKRILIQLKTNTVDRTTSYQLDKYRRIFNPGYTPRPNAKGKNRGGKKV